MPEETPNRRSVRDFCKHYGLSRNQFLVARGKAKIRPKDWATLLSASDEKALLRYVSAEKRSEQAFRRFREQPSVTTQFAPAPKPPVDYEAEINRILDSTEKWRSVLIELAAGHTANERNGRCKRCLEDSPCRTRRTLTQLENDLVERVAIADSGDLAEERAADQSLPDVDPERHLSVAYDARNRWRRALTNLAIDHMIEDERGHCAHCPADVPCDIRKAVRRINRGVASQIEKFASMDDGQLEAALGNRRAVRRQYDDWDAI